jgi:hypothetical protein
MASVSVLRQMLLPKEPAAPSSSFTAFIGPTKHQQISAVSLPAAALALVRRVAALHTSFFSRCTALQLTQALPRHVPHPPRNSRCSCLCIRYFPSWMHVHWPGQRRWCARSGELLLKNPVSGRAVWTSLCWPLLGAVAPVRHL